jgi:hypothetical protein
MKDHPSSKTMLEWAFVMVLKEGFHSMTKYIDKDFHHPS